MLFNSLPYLILFLPVALAGFLLLNSGRFQRAQLLWLVICSLFFYASWKPAYILLILGSIVVNYLVGRWLAIRIGGFGARLILTVGIAFNLLLLGHFKYTGFFLDSLNQLAGTLIPLPEITLPLAISFFTFQQIAYLVDVYRGEARDYSFFHYCLFVTFFPQLIAGPIVHHKEMMPQFDAPPDTASRSENLQVGITIIALGLFKKVVFADNLALMADPLFEQADTGVTLSMAEAWIAVLAFTGQIYFDFSGYTDMAIGSARLFGIRLPENFRSPYKAGNIIEFWRCWHITLSRFLREYLYISLGGNRRGQVRRYVNLMLTMLLGGLWHGANWNFVIWGGLHGIYLVINHFWRYLSRRQQPGVATPGVLSRCVSRCITLLAVMAAWVFFRAQTSTGAFNILCAMLDTSSWDTASASLYLVDVVVQQPLYGLVNSAFPDVKLALLPLTLLLIALTVCLFAPNTQQIMQKFRPVIAEHKTTDYTGLLVWRPSAGWAVTVALVLYLGLLGLGSASEFIYFQF